LELKAFSIVYLTGIKTTAVAVSLLTRVSDSAIQR